jgi:hypothetical protein
MGDTKSNEHDVVKGEIPPGAGSARRLERELDLGVKKVDHPAPGMPEYEGGGLTSEIGTTPKETDPG